MEYLIGAGLALGVAVCATLIGFDRDRSFYPTILVVIASTYDLFAAIGGSHEAFAIDGFVLAGFVGVSVIGFRTNLWLVAAGLFAHGMLDLVHGHLIANPGVPVWWPAFCMTYDVAAAAYLGWLLIRPGEARLHAGKMPKDRAVITARAAAVPVGRIMTALLVVVTLFDGTIAPRDVRRAMVGDRDIAYEMIGVGQPGSPLGRHV